jgi:RNA polymerase sigma-32 factor
MTFSSEDNLSHYFRQVGRFPLLDAETEAALANRWRDHRDAEAVRQLVGSHLRLVVKIARQHQGYGLPLSDLIAEGNVGLMQAVDKFEPDRGFRLATYAIWWIRAAIREYVLRSSSLVKVATTASRKKLFFNLRRLRVEYRAGHGELPPETVAAIAHELGVPEADVVEMDQRLGAVDQSLNAPLGLETESEWQDLLVDDSQDQETLVAEAEEYGMRRRLMDQALDGLNDRERHIFTERRLKDEPPTLEELSLRFQISRERVRQIEVRAFEKLQAAMREAEAAGDGPRPMVPPAPRSRGAALKRDRVRPLEARQRRDRGDRAKSLPGRERICAAWPDTMEAVAPAGAA